MKNIKLTLIVLATFLFSSCSVVYTTHNFQHHGTDSIKTSGNFKYVKYNVIGKARTTYYPNKLRKQQDPVKDGLIADAKANLNKLHPLKNNQAYANLTIDVLNTTKGTPTSGGLYVDEVTLEAVVSADIIEYEK